MHRRSTAPERVREQVAEAKKALEFEAPKFTAPLMDTPRTTVIACVLQGNAAYWAHCGDSRLYLVRDGKLIARTRDHSYSELQETLAHVVPMGEKFNRNVLFTCLGSPGKPVVDTAGPLLLRAGDRVLLCSDGLSDMVEDDDIHLTMSTFSASLETVAKQLIQLSNDNGGRDNVSIILAQVVDSFAARTGVVDRILRWFG